MKTPSAISLKQLVKTLDLEAHVEGGYYKQTFKANNKHKIPTNNGDRVSMTSIYYLLSKDSPIGHFHKNSSDIMHYFHTGDPISYFLIHPDGRLETRVLGPDILAGHKYQFVVEGGVWKASQLAINSVFGYGLIGEAVAPGFDYSDMELGKKSKLIEAFSEHKDLITRMTP